MFTKPRFTRDTAIPSGNPSRLDAGESAFFMREIEYIKSVTYDVKYKPLKALTLFPISTEANTGASSITWRQFAMVGNAMIIADYANDFPNSDVYAREIETKIYPIGQKYGYTIQEIRQSQWSGKRLDQRRAAATRRGVDQLINQIAFTGLPNYSINGFFGYPGITSYTVPSDGTGSSPLWTNKTGDQIVRDVTGLVNGVVSSTSGVEEPDTLLLPIANFVYIASTPRITYSDRTILEYLLASSPFIKRVDWIPELATAGAGSGTRMMAFANDDMHLSLEIPQPFEQFDPEQKGLQFDIPCHARTAGLLVYYPMSVAYGDGI